MVAPIGRTKRHTRGSTWFLVSSKLMVTGSVALLEPVPKAVVMAFAMFAINLNGKVLVTTENISGSTTKPWTNKPESIAMYIVLVHTSVDIDL